jgi:nitrite reductase/ring-hydroxylating ferredoxin subunit
VAEWVRVCDVSEVREGRALGVEVAGWWLAIVRDGDTWRALSARCPHANGPLDRGWVEGGDLVCPLHHWRFRVATGRCVTDRGYSVRTFACDERDGGVWVEAP